MSDKITERYENIRFEVTSEDGEFSLVGSQELRPAIKTVEEGGGTRQMQPTCFDNRLFDSIIKADGKFKKIVDIVDKAFKYHADHIAVRCILIQDDLSFRMTGKFNVQELKEANETSDATASYLLDQTDTLMGNLREKVDDLAESNDDEPTEADGPANPADGD